MSVCTSIKIQKIDSGSDLACEFLFADALFRSEHWMRLPMTIDWQDQEALERIQRHIIVEVVSEGEWSEK